MTSKQGPMKVLTEEGVKVLYDHITSITDELSRVINFVGETKLNKDRIFIGTMKEYQEANGIGSVPVGALVVITDEDNVQSPSSGKTISRLGIAIIGSMILGQE